jgi:hypothetical protein
MSKASGPALIPASGEFLPAYGCLLVPESILITAIRALPGDAVAGHAPNVIVHTFLANFKTAAATPAENELPAAAVALMQRLPAALSS